MNCLNCGHSEGHHDDGDACGANVGSNICLCAVFRRLKPDPIDGTREGWRFCDECAGIQSPTHAHDEFESMSRDELLARLRALPKGNP